MDQNGLQPGADIRPGAQSEPPVPLGPDNQAPQTPLPGAALPTPTKPTLNLMADRLAHVLDPAKKDAPPVHQDPEETLLSWDSPEFTFKQKAKSWFLIVYVVMILLVALAVIFKEWMAVGLFVVLGIAIMVFANRQPRNLHYIITTYGIHVGEKLYDFDSFTSFYEADDFGQRVFELLSNKRFAPTISLPIPAEHADEIEDILVDVLPQIEPKNDLLERILRRLGF